MIDFIPTDAFVISINIIAITAAAQWYKIENTSLIACNFIILLTLFSKLRNRKFLFYWSIFRFSRQKIHFQQRTNYAINLLDIFLKTVTKKLIERMPLIHDRISSHTRCHFH
jgi:hypothetical protein